MPGAERHPLPDTAPTDGQYPPRVVAHITWDSVPVSFDSMVGYFTDGGEGQSRAPHLLWDPIGGRIAQFYPATSRSKSVQDHAGGTRTNRAGPVCIQIEALLAPGKTVYNGRVCHTLLDTPCTNWPALLAWVCTWGVPCVWPMGVPDWTDQRDEHVWETRGGWYGHSQVPENDHTDPGPWPAFTDDGSVTLMASQYEMIMAELAALSAKVDAGSLASSVGKGTGRVTGWQELADATNLDAGELGAIAGGVHAALAPALAEVSRRLEELTATVAGLAAAVGPARPQ